MYRLRSAGNTDLTWVATASCAQSFEFELLEHQTCVRFRCGVLGICYMQPEINNLCSLSVVGRPHRAGGIRKPPRKLGFDPSSRTTTRSRDLQGIVLRVITR